MPDHRRISSRVKRARFASFGSPQENVVVSAKISEDWPVARSEPGATAYRSSRCQFFVTDTISGLLAVFAAAAAGVSGVSNFRPYWANSASIPGISLLASARSF